MSAPRRSNDSAEPLIIKEHSQRAMTMYEERRIEDRGDCLGRLTAVLLALGLFLHPGLCTPHSFAVLSTMSGAGAFSSSSAPAFTSPAWADEGYDAQAGCYWLEVPPGTLDGADFAIPTPSTLLRYLREHGCEDVDGVAALLLTGIDIAARGDCITPDPLLLACIARPESGFDDSCVGAAGERGLLQVHPCHKRAMRAAGLDFADGADRIAFACQLWAARGLLPWTTRRAALRDYRRYCGEPGGAR